MSIPAPWILAQLPAHPSIPEVLEYQVTGLVVVFLALGSLWVLLEIMGRFFRRRLPAAAPALKRPTTAAIPADIAAPEPLGPTPALLAAISAAVHVALAGRAHRIAAIQPAPVAAAWAAEGRREIFSSHRVR